MVSGSKLRFWLSSSYVSHQNPLKLLLFCLLSAAALLLCTSAKASAQALAVPGEFIIKFSDSPTSSARSMRSKLGVRMIKHSSLTQTQLVSAYGGELNHKYLKGLLASGQIEYVEPNYIYRASATPTDSRFSELWGMHNTGQTGGSQDVDIDAPEAWDLTNGSTEVIVGIVDTGVDYMHPDLQANMWKNPNEIPGNNIDDDSNGVVDDVYGYNAIAGSGDPLDDHGHGTHCAGTIGGVGNNGEGVAGVNWNVKIMGLKFLNAFGSGSTQGAIDAIEYAVNLKNSGVNIRVLSNSWGGGGYSQALADAVQAASDAGILFVAAAGNNGSDNDVSPTYPANYDPDSVISVAAVDHDGNLASFSNYGAVSVDVAAPGVDILSTALGGGYVKMSGTSMATPHVSGVAALLAASEPSLDAAALKARLSGTIKALPALTAQVAAAGTVSAYRALTNTLTPTPPADPSLSYQKSSIGLDFDPALGTRVLNVDDGYTEVELGFSFPYYGEPLSKIAVSANGRVIPLADDESAPTTLDYSNRLSDGINPLHDDFTPSHFSSTEGGVWVKDSGTSATITWVVVSYAHRISSSPEAEMRFQVKLFANGAIEFHYLDTDTGDAAYSAAASATIGLVPPSGVAGERLLISHNSANLQDAGSLRAISLTQGNMAQGQARSDFDGDGVSDIAVWRPATGMWYINRSSAGFRSNELVEYQLGLNGDIPQTGDFDGDGLSDMAVWRPSNGTWYFRNSSTSYQTITATQWGLPGDTPLVGDHDGDGKSDLVVYRVELGLFYALLSNGGFVTIPLGGPANDPVIGDFTGDGRDDFVAIWQLVRFWTIKDSANTFISTAPWGEAGDTPLACDVDGDNISDRVIVRVSENGTLDWWIATAAGPAYSANFGSMGDVPSCDRDYDGDGENDIAVFREWSGEWFIRNTSTRSFSAIQFGLPGDVPL